MDEPRPSCSNWNKNENQFTESNNQSNNIIFEDLETRSVDSESISDGLESSCESSDISLDGLINTSEVIMQVKK